MPMNTSHDRLERLEKLTNRLKLNQPVVLREIADEFGVSLRTINRDVNLLRNRGLPIESDRGRGGGVRIARTWGIGRVALTYHEAVDLLISIASIEKMQIPMIYTESRSIRNKLVASFSNEDQAKISRLSHRIRVGPTSSPQVINSYKSNHRLDRKVLYECFTMQNHLKMQYSSEVGKPTTRIIEPHYMVLNHPAWYLLCWDHLRGAVRTFRCDRISSLKKIDTNFSLREWSDFADSMEGNALIIP
jgi:predicted DNA-binding transcriptional regulator YafY